MKDFTKNVLMLLCFLFAGNLAFSQTPFWTEEFADSMPAGWTALEVAGDMSATSNWVWTNTGPAGSFSIGPVVSTSAANGWMLFDSDLNCSGEQDVWLISPQLDLTNNDLVVLQFETFYRRFNDVTSIEVSTDSVTWTFVPVFDGLGNNDYGDGAGSPGNAANPQIVTMDLTAYAANAGSFWFAFHFLADATTVQGGDPGCGYSWQVDDVRLLDQDPTPATNLRLGDFFYPPASFAQPVSQIPSDTMGFFADVSNIGTATVTNVVLKAEVKQADGTVLWVDSLLIPAVDTSVVDSTFFLDNTFVPDQLVVGDYEIAYSLYSLDADDADMTNNSSSEIFVVTDNLWSKENGATTAYRPGGGPNDYVIGNVYITNANLVDQYKATEVTFTAAKNQADGNLAGDVVNIILTEINEDVLAPDWSNFDDQADLFTNDAMSLRAFVQHTFTTNSTSGTETEMLTDFDEETPGVLLKPGNRYMLLASYEGENNVIFHGFSEEISYFQISTVLWSGGDNQWFLGAFGPEPAAVLRMAIDLYSTVDNTPLPDNALRFYPNPASSVLNVELSLEQPTLTNITIAEMSGRVLFIDEIENASRESLQYNVSQYPSGTYLIRVATEYGTSTKQFIVQH
ncbi:MAG: T9SS type A sorting domain-containing protein [Saprospiraceae bacterium]